MEKFEKLMLPITLGLLIILGWIFLSNSKDKSTISQTTVEGISSNSKVYDAKQGSAGAVLVEVTPLSSTKYQISLNTHSVDLDLDFTKIIKLKDDLGNMYEALYWSGSSGGHHLSGEVTFPKITDQARGVTIIISDIEGEVLNFEWML